MSFEEPKAPIVRIRKKRTKKKSKDSDIVHLPVRASQQGRYSSLTTPPNPQTKGRECCRVFFAGCMKIPVCRLVCFRCILPKCYSGEGSDDEDVNVKDEGYHSQNRRSSEISPSPEGGAQGGSEPQTVEMTEIKSETVTLIPPPRTTVNDYRRDPCKSETSDGKDNGEVTYIEVESVSLTGSDAVLNIPDSDTDPDETKVFKLEMLETGYEEPVQAGVLEFPILKSSGNDDISEYVDPNLSDDSESKIYVNESVLGIVTDSEKKYSKTDESYINVGPPDSENNIHSKPKIDNPHDYINLTPFETEKKSGSDEPDVFKTSFETSETKHLELLKERKVDIDIVQTVVKEKKQTVKKMDHNTTKSGYPETDDMNKSETEFVVDNSDAEKLLNTSEQKVQETETDSQDDLEDNSENDIAGDQTKLL